MRRFLFALALVVSFHSAPHVRAQDDEPITYTRFLVPLYHLPVPGAYGSLWEVETWGHFCARQSGYIVPRPSCGAIQCIGVEGQLDAETPVFPVRPWLAREFPSGVLFHIDSRVAAEITFASRVRDRSRQAESAGTEVPVIREDRIVSRPLSLLNVPIAPRYRNTLRIYALPDVENPEVEIRYRRQPEFTFSHVEGTTSCCAATACNSPPTPLSKTTVSTLPGPRSVAWSRFPS